MTIAPISPATVAVRSVEPLSTTMISSTNGGSSRSTSPIPISSLRQGMTTVMRRFLYMFHEERGACSAPGIGEAIGIIRSSFDRSIQGQIYPVGSFVGMRLENQFHFLMWWNSAGLLYQIHLAVGPGRPNSLCLICIVTHKDGKYFIRRRSCLCRSLKFERNGDVSFNHTRAFYGD